MSEIFSLQLTAAASLALAILALATALFAGGAFRAQFREHQREVEERRRSQATGVSAWLTTDEHPLGGPMLAAVLSNQSGQPVYDVQAHLHCMEEYRPSTEWVAAADGASTVIKIVAPRTELHVGLSQHASPYPGEDDGMVFAVSVMFTDAAENRWERDPGGALKPAPRDSAYIVGGPRGQREQPPSALPNA